MDHYIPKRRIPVTLWSDHVPGVQGSVFLDLDPSGNRHQTVLEKLNEPARFLAVAIGAEGRIQLFNKHRLARITAGKQVAQSDVFARGFLPWREEHAEVRLADGTALVGRVWMPLARETQRLSDFLNQHDWEFFPLLTPSAIHLIHNAAVVGVELPESAGAPLSPLEGEERAA
ncbi:MAG: hypothetical protein HOP12_12860 [Candidatus Eisenbacteria bacterium]|uniref:Uncharacterized protein n=1 Tax=Eiseniibacteriota bacterium TaxID=2212470 RepID=A0A849SH15_UNCEI|nr:hypothetical protein [Candidatus Eisenbacteria bacterium]